MVPELMEIAVYRTWVVIFQEGKQFAGLPKLIEEQNVSFFQQSISQDNTQEMLASPVWKT